MLTKAIIQSIDYTKNICKVRIPLFENASKNVNMIEADAQLNIVPGIYNSYKTGDVVFIGFEENKMELPVILGKLFVSASAEASSYQGVISGSSLAITDTAQIPYSTVFDFTKITQNDKLYVDLNTPKKLADSILDLQRAQEQSQKYQTVISVLSENNSYKLYLKTADDYTYSPDKSDEPLYRLCTALKNSQSDGVLIPLDFVTDPDNSIYKAALMVEKFTAGTIKLRVFIDGTNDFDIIKDNTNDINDIQSIRSSAIYY